MRHLILCVLFFLAITWPWHVAAQDTISDQEQDVDNSQEITTGGQALIIPYPRGFSSGNNPLPHNVPTPVFFAPPAADANFGSLNLILGYKSRYTAEDAGSLMQSHGKVRVITTCFVPEDSRTQKHGLRILADPGDKDEFNSRYEQIGIGNYKALDSDTISEQILGIAIMEGLNIGADAMIFYEGASLAQVSCGYSVGLSDAFSVVNEGIGDGKGNVGLAGLGFGNGQSRYTSRPWLRTLFFREVRSASGSAGEKTRALPEGPEKKSESNFEKSLQREDIPELKEKAWETQPHP